MIHDLFMPCIGISIVELKVIEWLKSPGERVKKGETVLVVESDKANLDIESFNSGYLAAILIQAGERDALGEAAALIAETKEEIPLARKQAQKLVRSKWLEGKFERKLHGNKILAPAILSSKFTHKIKTDVLSDRLNLPTCQT